MKLARNLITGAMLAGALNGCAPRQQHEGLEAFKKENVHLLDKDGDEVNIEKFTGSLNSRYTTLSFMFGGCGSTCPRTTAELAEISQKYPDVKHVVVSLLPATDIERATDSLGNQDPYTSLEHSLMGWGLQPGKNVFVLYPSETGKRDYYSLFSSGEKSRELSDSLNEAFYQRKMAPLQSRMGMAGVSATDHNRHGSGVSFFEQGRLIGYAPLSEVQQVADELLKTPAKEQPENKSHVDGLKTISTEGPAR